MPSSGWELPVSMQATTGIVYATSFPAPDAAIAEVSKYFSHHISLDQSVRDIISILRQKLQTRMTSTYGTSPVLSSDIEEALTNLSDVIACGAEDGSKSSAYELDRKFLFRVLVLGNAQLAQIIKARGPNMQTNAACAGMKWLRWVLYGRSGVYCVYTWPVMSSQ